MSVQAVCDRIDLALESDSPEGRVITKEEAIAIAEGAGAYRGVEEDRFIHDAFVGKYAGVSLGAREVLRQALDKPMGPTPTAGQVLTCVGASTAVGAGVGLVLGGAAAPFAGPETIPGGVVIGAVVGLSVGLALGFNPGTFFDGDAE